MTVGIVNWISSLVAFKKMKDFIILLVFHIIFTCEIAFKASSQLLQLKNSFSDGGELRRIKFPEDYGQYESSSTKKSVFAEDNNDVRKNSSEILESSANQVPTRTESDVDIGRSICECGKLPFAVSLGQKSGINQFPFVVALVMGGLLGGGHPLCSGTLINNIYVLTAARCLDHLEPKDLQVWLTVRDSLVAIQNTDIHIGFHKLSIVEFIIHPNWNRETGDNDIGLVRLLEPIDIGSSSNYFIPACLPSVARSYTGEIAEIIGWASILQTDNGKRTNDHMCVTRMPVLDTQICNRDSLRRNLTDNNICAGYLGPTTTRNRNTCMADIGSPLVISSTAEGQQQRHTLIGIMSWGTQHPNVYIKVSGYAEWIIHNSLDSRTVWCGI